MPPPPPPSPLPRVYPCPICRRGALQWTQIHLEAQPGRTREHVDVECSDTNCGARFDWLRGGWEVPDSLELKACHDSAALKSHAGAKYLKDWFPPGTEGEILPAGSAPVSPGWPVGQAIAILVFAALLLFGHFGQEFSWTGALMLALVATGLVAVIYAGLRSAVRDRGDGPPTGPGAPPKGGSP